MDMKIGVISAWADAEDTYNQAIGDAGYPLLFKTALMNQAASVAQSLLNEEHVHAVITLGIPMEVFSPNIASHIYPIYPSSYDVLYALYKALKIGKNPAFAEIPFSLTLYDCDTICTILQAHITRYHFSRLAEHTDLESVEAVIRKIADAGHDVMVTMGGFSHTLAGKYGIPSVPVMPEPASFRVAIENIGRTLRMKQAETEKAMWLNAAFDDAKEGVMVLDRSDRIVVINSSAQTFMHLQAEDIVGRPAEEVHSTNPLFQKFLYASGSMDVIHSRTRSYVVKRSILYADQSPLGTVIRANPVKELQKLEMDARRKISESGFTAAATFTDIRGSSPGFEAIKQKAKRYAASQSNVALYGESGSGKELFAQSIHNASPAAKGPFVAVNCTVLTENLLESELFGYEEGAFTGARKGGRPGLFELAHKGTLFLDEIGDMPPGIQVKLLRVLQERKVRRIGGSKNIPVDVRLIFATNRDLRAAVDEGRFRQDLFFRINVLSLYIPPLRQHKADLKEISQDILKRLSVRTGRLITLSDESFAAMEDYHWPGNIRELSNFLERASFLDYQSDTAIRGMLRELTLQVSPDEKTGVLQRDNVLSVGLSSLHNMENAIIRTLFEEQGLSRREIERELNISTSSLYRRLKEMGLI